jgi:organic radical activating enzyme
MKDQLTKGKALPVMEEFYSLQGEGFHTGKPAYFLRIGGCDVGCAFCDVKESWNAEQHPLILTDRVIERILENPSKAVVVTGGEPLLYSLDYLTQTLKQHAVQLFLETSGSEPLSGVWDWICLSPKRNAPPLQDIFLKAHELKMIICDETDFELAERYAEKVGQTCLLWLQPEWSRVKVILPKIVDYALTHPRWNVSIQSHKYMKIP